VSAVFSEAWLRSYEAGRVRTPSCIPDRIEFVLQRAFKPLNELLRMHWSDRTRYAAGLSAHIALLTRHIPPGTPMLRARLTVTRYGMRLPDKDGLYGGAKPLIDALLVISERHPHGLGFIADDGPEFLDLIVSSELAKKRAAVRTHVLIERLQ
jgi:hypothetical protein